MSKSSSANIFWTQRSSSFLWFYWNQKSGVVVKVRWFCSKCEHCVPTGFTSTLYAQNNDSADISHIEEFLTNRFSNSTCYECWIRIWRYGLAILFTHGVLQFSSGILLCDFSPIVLYCASVLFSNNLPNFSLHSWVRPEAQPRVF